MNLGDAIKTVFRTRSHVLAEHWKQDAKFVIQEATHDLKRFVKSSATTIKSARPRKFKVKFKESYDSASDTFLILRVLPARVREGVTYFKDDFLLELDSQLDQKHKTLFSLKVIGALTSFALTTIYQIKRGTTDIALPGLKNKNNLTNFVVAELLFKLTHLFVQRFLHELEQHVTDEEELQHISYFKQLLISKEEIEQLEHEPPQEDRAIEIVEALKHFIITGKRFD